MSVVVGEKKPNNEHSRPALALSGPQPTCANHLHMAFASATQLTHAMSQRPPVHCGCSCPVPACSIAHKASLSRAGEVTISANSRNHGVGTCSSPTQLPARGAARRRHSHYFQTKKKPPLTVTAEPVPFVPNSIFLIGAVSELSVPKFNSLHTSPENQRTWAVRRESSPTLT